MFSEIYSVVVERLSTDLISWCRSGYHKDIDNGRKAWNNGGTSADLKGKKIRSTNADPRMVNSLSCVLFANDPNAAPFLLLFQYKTHWIPCCSNNLSQESIDVGTDKYQQ